MPKLFVHLLPLLVVAVAGISSTTVASAATPAAPLLREVSVGPAVHAPPRSASHAVLSGTPNAAVFAAAAVDVELPEGRAVTARQQRTVVDARSRQRTWIGTFDEEPGSLLVLSEVDGGMTGFANLGPRTFELVPGRQGRHVFYEVDVARLPQADRFETNLADAAAPLEAASSDASGPVSTTAVTSGSVVQDVLLLYTPAAATQWGQSTIEGMIRAAVQAANQAYVSSLVRVTLNVVGLARAPIQEASSMSGTVDALRNSATVRALRDQLGADMVVVISQNSDLCGTARLWHTISGTTSNWDAYAAVNSRCLSSRSFVHEVGHLQQLDHNRENTTGFRAYPYSYGYRRCVTGGFRDIMAYPCSTSVTQLNYFSNPDLSYNGYPLGIDYEADPTRAADNARSLNGTASLVAGYRPSKTTTATVPAAPTSPTAANGGNGTATVRWTDASSNETRFDVARSRWDPVTRTWSARSSRGSVGANVTRFVDSSGKGTFRYYVRAANGAGVSAYAGPATVTVTGG